MGSTRHRSPDPPRFGGSSCSTRAPCPFLFLVPAEPFSTHLLYPYPFAMHLTVGEDGYYTQAIHQLLDHR
jgi:hypothetical protein